jgi:hypothetical protein
MKLDENYKALLAVLVSAAGALITALATTSSGNIGDIDLLHWLIALGTVVGSGALVWFAENIEGVAGGIIKSALSFLSAGIASLIIALDDDVISQAEWLTAFIAAVLATGLVYQVPNAIPKTKAKAVA